MKSNYYTYSAIFDDKKYQEIDNNYKYILALMYSNMNISDNVFKMNPNDFIDKFDVLKGTFRRGKLVLKKYNLIEEIKPHMYIMKTPQNTEKIFIHEELIIGKYRHLGKGTKLFYSYFLKKQMQQGQDYIHYTIADLMKPFAGSHKTTNKYCKELVEAGLLDKVDKGRSYKYHFKEI
ncbi:hypothetical protein ACY2DA_13275 [Staphylococcus simulans]